jgi:hypothetical protein
VILGARPSRIARQNAHHFFISGLTGREIGYPDNYGARLRLTATISMARLNGAP